MIDHTKYDALLENWKKLDPNGYDAAIHEQLDAAGFEDSSWHNDISPSFHHDATGLRVWIDYASADQRETDGEPRFHLSRYTSEMDWVEDIASSDDFAAIISEIHKETTA